MITLAERGPLESDIDELNLQAEQGFASREAVPAMAAMLDRADEAIDAAIRGEPKYLRAWLAEWRGEVDG